MSRVVIITRTIDRPVLLERTLQSILAQTYTDWHWVVVDGGNTDAVPRLAHGYGERLQGRITHLRFVNPKPGMRGIPLNAGIKESQSEFITLLDDDDTWDPSYLQTMVRAMDTRPHPNVRGSVCRTLCIHESSVEHGLKPQRSYELNPKLANITLPVVAVVNCFCTHAFLYDRSALETVGMYPEDYPVLEDWHFNLRFLLHHEIVVVPQTLTHYHFRPPEVDGVQANSQTAERDDHKFHEARLINEALREDLRTGKMGLGHILSQAALTRQLNATLHSHESRMKSIGDKTGKIDTRTKELKDKLLDKRG